MDEVESSLLETFTASVTNGEFDSTVDFEPLIGKPTVDFLIFEPRELKDITEARIIDMVSVSTFFFKFAKFFSRNRRRLHVPNMINHSFRSSAQLRRSQGYWSLSAIPLS